MTKRNEGSPQDYADRPANLLDALKKINELYEGYDEGSYLHSNEMIALLEAGQKIEDEKSLFELHQKAASKASEAFYKGYEGVGREPMGIIELRFGPADGKALLIGGKREKTIEIGFEFHTVGVEKRANLTIEEHEKNGNEGRERDW